MGAALSALFLFDAQIAQEGANEFALERLIVFRQENLKET